MQIRAFDGLRSAGKVRSDDKKAVSCCCCTGLTARAKGIAQSHLNFMVDAILFLTFVDIWSACQAGEPGWGATKPRTGLSRRDLNVPAPAPPAATAKESKRRAGSSMSSLLQSRSESAVVERKQAAPISPIPDIDKDDKSDPLAASDYVGDIITYYRRIEPLYRVAPDYMSRQVCCQQSTTMGPPSEKLDDSVLPSYETEHLCGACLCRWTSMTR